MQSIITLSGLSYAAPDGRVLFDRLDLAFGSERTGLVGRNGAGKTTLIRLILGELTPSAGSVAVRGRLGLLRQAVAPAPDATAADLVGARDALACLRRIESGLGSDEDLEVADWTLEARLQAALAEVDLSGLDLDRPASSLSGGEATRAALAGLLAAEPDLLILDEPTNNLDAGARGIVAEVLGRWRGGAIAASHDRTLLRAMDRTVEVSGLGVRLYGGGYDLYAERKAEERAAADQAVAVADRDAVRIEREVQTAQERKARRDSAGRRFAAKGGTPNIVLGAMAERAENSTGRESHLAARRRGEAAERLAGAQSQVERLKTLNFSLPPTGLAAGRVVLTMEEAGFAYPGEPPLFEGLSMTLTGPVRIAVAGPNGSGKSSLLRMIAGEAAPPSGSVQCRVSGAIFDQQASLLQGGTILENFRRLNPEESDNACRGALARFQFRADAALRMTDSLSGGERLRAALACVLGGATPPQLLILDEPTNHLDLDSIAAVEAALLGYDGGLIVVSHDEDFLVAIGVTQRLDLGAGAPPVVRSL